MPKLADKLTALAVEKARAKDATYTLPDGNGLFLQVRPSGLKSWVVRYRSLDGKQHPIVVGEYPDMGLADARAKAAEIHLSARTDAPVVGKRAEIKALVASQTEAERAAQAAAEDVIRHSFNAFSEAWLKSRQPGWADETYRKARYVVRDYLQPKLGDKDMRVLRTG